MAHEPSFSSRPTHTGIAAALSSLRARIRAVLLINRILIIVAALLAAAVLLGVTDYLVRLPTWIRSLHWTLGLFFIAFLIHRYLRPAWRFNPSLTNLALRIERERPEVRGLLASAIDFELETDAPRAALKPPPPLPAGEVQVHPPRRESSRAEGASAASRQSRTLAHNYGPNLTTGLALTVLRRAENLWNTSNSSGLIKPRTTFRFAGAVIAASSIAAALFAISPKLTTIGALRLAAPWAGAAWPKLTGVADMTETSVHARGTALPLQAAVIKSNKPWDSTYVAVRYRLINADITSPERRELLTWQEREVETPFAEPGALFERLIEPAADAVEFRFETEDDATDWRRIRLVPPPAVVDAKAVITPPAYAQQILASENTEESRVKPLTADLGPGTDDRAVAPPSLAGSEIELTITLNKPVEMPESVAELFVDPESPLDTPGRASIKRAGTTWTIRWTLADSLRLPIRLRDEFGIESTDEAVFRFEALADRPAAATIVEPGSDRTVLPTAVVPITAEGRDDVGLAWIALEQSLWTPAGEPGAKSPPGGALEQRGEPIQSARLESVGKAIERTSIELDLKPLDLKPGDEVRLFALAIDARAASDEAAAPTRSAPRTLRVISEAQFVEEVQRTLAEVRQAAIRADEQQESIRTQTQSGRADAAVRKGQGAISERLARQSDTVRRLADRVRENRVEDRALEELLARAKSTINDAGQASSRASQSLERSASPVGQVSPPVGQASSLPESGSPTAKAEPDGSEPDQATSGAKGSPAQSKPADSAGDPQQGSPPSGQPSSPSSSDSPSQSPEQPQQSGAPSGQPSAPQQGGQSPPQQPQPTEDQPPPGGEARTTDPDLQQAAEAQQEVQDDLRSLIELLDRGEDNWLARNTIERLAKEQKELREKTQQTGKQTAGKTADQLTPEQRTDLDQIVEKQSQLADQTAELAKDLREREKALREKDPAAAQGMAQAARRAEQSQVAQTMRNAASEAQQNQTSRASRQQQQAEEALEEMLEDLNRVDKARDEVLRRELASIIETLEGLIRQQEAELAALEASTRANKGLEGLDDGAIRLNQNTLGALDQIKAVGPDAAPVATLVSRAADAQSGAITEIRRPIVGATMVREFENRSLTNLKQALAKANEIDAAAADRERKKKLAELKKLYREALERQVSVRDETQPLGQAAELSRRDKQTARALSERQETIGADLKQMLTQTKELQDAKVFDFAHVRLDKLSRAAAAALTDAKITDSLASQSSLITTLKNIIEALNDPKPDEKKFAEGAGGGGGGGGGAAQEPLLPPVKELMLLRQMQTDLAQQTIETSKLETAPPQTIKDLGNAQRELTTVGQEFVERIKKQNAPTVPKKESPDAPKE